MVYENRITIFLAPSCILSPSSNYTVSSLSPKSNGQFSLLPFVLHTIVSPQMSVAILGVNSLPGWILRAHGQAGGWDQPCSVFACVFSLLGWSEVPRCGDGEETEKGVFEREG